MSTKAEPWNTRWTGRTVACIASGPSLTAADCERVRQAGLPAIVTNTTVRMVPWAEVLVGFDSAWWKLHAEEVRTFAGQRFSCSSIAAKFGARQLQSVLRCTGFGNSGTAAICLAAQGGAARVVLLGFDCQHTGGQTHWHGNHPAGLGNAASVARWFPKFAQAAAFAAGKGCTVVNASRETALTCFPRVGLEDELAAFLHP